MALSLGRRPNLLRHYFSVAQFSCRIGSSETRGFRSSRLLEVAPCKEEFEIGSYRVSFETSTPPDTGSGDQGIVLTMQKKKNDQSLSKVFSTVSASPLLPDVIPHSSPRLKVDYQGNQFPCNDRVGSSFVRRDSARIIRAPIRPLFPAHFYHDVEVMARVLCCNGEQDTDVMSANAASAALMLSDIPWGGPIGVVRIGRIRGEFLVNPSRDELSFCDLELVYACTRDHKTLMADVQAHEVTENDLEEALQLAHRQAVKYLAPQIILAERAGKHKKDYTLSMLKESTIKKITSLVEAPSKAILPDFEHEKIASEETLVKLAEDVEKILDVEEHNNKEKIKVIPKMVDMLQKKVFRRWIVEENLRVDGRRLEKVRQIKCESTKMSEFQGSSLFSCGPTQVICTVTQRRPGENEAENMGGDLLLRIPRYSYKSRPFRVDGNWKIGDCDSYDEEDGNFVEQALVFLLPKEYRFPYVVRVNSQAIQSDGSVSTATVCGGSIALMVSGVPLKKPVAGVSVGMVCSVHPANGKMCNYRILTDLSSLEEHLVDMNFKVAGSRDGITAIRMDVNVAGVPLGIICECLGHALKGRLEILDQMEQEISAPSICTSDDWGWNDKIVVPYKLATKYIELLAKPDGAWQRDFEQETGARISMSKYDEEIYVSAKNKTSYMLAKQKVETIIGKQVEAGGLPHEHEATKVKSYVGADGGYVLASEVPFEQVDGMSGRVYAVQRQEMSQSDGLYPRVKYDFQTKICGLSDHSEDDSRLYECDFSEYEVCESSAKL